MAELQPGDPDRLGAYDLVGRLGEGGQGVVYEGRGPQGERVAIKLLRARFADDEKARARFVREIEAAERVAGFCTAKVLDADTAGDQPYIASEFVPGPSLQQLVREEGPRSGAELQRVAIGTATALTAIHRAGIVHRDFKPPNVLMGPDGPRVIDFGIARALDASTVTSTVVGTPSYMAPEQVSGATIGPPTDVFAWGLTIVFAATGAPAFGEDSIPAVLNRILHAEPNLTALPPPLARLIAGCLSKDPARRPTAAQAVQSLLDASGAPQAAAVPEEDLLEQAVTIATGKLEPPPLAPAPAPPSPAPPSPASPVPPPPAAASYAPPPAAAPPSTTLPPATPPPFQAPWTAPSAPYSSAPYASPMPPPYAPQPMQPAGQFVPPPGPAPWETPRLPGGRPHGPPRGGNAVVALLAVLLALLAGNLHQGWEALGSSEMARDLDVSVSGSWLTWLFTVNPVLTLLAVLPAGRLADAVGRKKVFLAGVAGFAIATGIAGLSANGPMLLAARGLQGLTAAFLLAPALAVLRDAFRDRLFAMMVGVVGVTFVIPVGGGRWAGAELVDLTNWRVPYFAVLPLLVVAGVVGAVGIRESRRAGPARPADAAVLVPLSLCLAGVALGWQASDPYGWTDWRTLGPLVFGLLMLAVVIILQPFVKPRLLTPLPAATALLSMAAFAAVFLAGTMIVFRLQSAEGASLAEGTLKMLPAMLVGLAAAPTAGALCARLGPRIPLAAGAALAALGALGLGLTTGEDVTYVLVVPWVVLYGLALAGFTVAAGVAFLDDAPDELTGFAGGLWQAAMVMGGLLVNLLFQLHSDIGSDFSTAAVADSYQTPTIVAGVLALVAALVAAVLAALRRPVPAAPPTPGGAANLPQPRV